MEFPARVTLLSGAIVLLQNTSQMEALPLGVAFQSEGRDGMDGTHLYREVLLPWKADNKRLKVELQAAAAALDIAAQVIRDGGLSPLKARQTHEAAEAARKALEDQVNA